MIGYVEGKLLETLISEVIVDVNGIGYELKVPITTYSSLGKKGSQVSLFVYTHVRENGIELYGFSTAEEKKLFKILLTVNGVGPKIALSLLSGMPFEKLKGVLAQGHIQALVSIPGVGRKTAERIVMELKGKLKIFDTTLSPLSSSFDDAFSALTNLGYKEKDVRDALQKLEGENLSVEDVIRGALREFSKGL